jgi:hypothetical protein
VRVTLCLALIAAVVAGCGEGSERAPATLTGLIVEIEGEGSDITAFTLEESGSGEEYEIRIAHEVSYGFDLGHLRQHQREKLPVVCGLEERDGDLYALRIVDA